MGSCKKLTLRPAAAAAACSLFTQGSWLTVAGKGSIKLIAHCKPCQNCAVSIMTTQMPCTAILTHHRIKVSTKSDGSLAALPLIFKFFVIYIVNNDIQTEIWIILPDMPICMLSNKTSLLYKYIFLRTG